MRKMLFFACLLLGLSACEKDPDMNQLDADLVVYTDYDKDADFGSYKTYFLPDSILEAGGHRATYWKDENAKAIINKVAAEMDARGYTRILDPEKKEEANVGLQLSYVAQTTQVITVATGAAGGIMVSGVPGLDGIIRILYLIPIIPIPW